MSGGHFDYVDSHLKHEIFGYDNECKNPLEDYEISELVSDVLDLIHEFDWYKSGDTREDSYLTAKAKFKAKWLGSNSNAINDARAKADAKEARLLGYIDGSLSALRTELHKLITE